jgi:hypothetical protein
MFQGRFDTTTARSLDALDRWVIAYLVLPLALFVVGWLHWWVAAVLVACMAYALRPLWDRRGDPSSTASVSRLHFAMAICIGAGWTVFGGAGHLLFANMDWHIRDAVLHDLVTSSWPVGYGELDGRQTVLRAPLAFYLPAAAVGKLAGLAAADLAMALWTALGTCLFLLQVLTLFPSRFAVSAMAAAVVVFFSGFDIIGWLLNYGGRFRDNWNIAMHLEWWAGSYQYSSMTTQLFWVPNHALGGWLIIGLLFRDRATLLNPLLPIVLVSAALWSPLSAVGAAPFVIWRLCETLFKDRSVGLLHPRVWGPSLIVGVVVVAYLVLDPSRISKGLAVAGKLHAAVSGELLRQLQFFMLEAGILGFAILAIRQSSEVVLSLVILAVLPLVYLGPANDLVMRASIPSLTVLAIGAGLALAGDGGGRRKIAKKGLLGCCLVIGAVTPIAEFARAAVLPVWPQNRNATIVAADCGNFPPHYIARLGDEAVVQLLRSPHPVSPDREGPTACINPAYILMHARHLL